MSDVAATLAVAGADATWRTRAETEATLIMTRIIATDANRFQASKSTWARRTKRALMSAVVVGTASAVIYGCELPHDQEPFADIRDSSFAGVVTRLDNYYSAALVYVDSSTTLIEIKSVLWGNQSRSFAEIVEVGDSVRMVPGGIIELKSQGDSVWTTWPMWYYDVNDSTAD